MTSDLKPMYPTSGAVPSDEAAWAYEPRWRGLRTLAVIDQGTVKLIDQQGADISAAYPELLEMGGTIGVKDAVLDGEIVAVGTDGHPDSDSLYERVQVDAVVSGRVLASEIPVMFYAFDLLSLDGRLTVNMSYKARRDFLEGLGLDGRSWATSPSWSELTLDDALETAAGQGLEGVVAKRMDARYQPGELSDDWRTFNHHRSQDLVVGGWTSADDGDDELVSLLVGYPDDTGLRFAGSVGAGITARRSRLLHERLDPLERSVTPFVHDVDLDSTVHWVEPRVVVNVSFEEWDDDGRARNATYRGIRMGATASDVCRED